LPPAARLGPSLTFAVSEAHRAEIARKFGQHEAMLRALAIKADMQERRIAGLEASETDRRDDAHNIARAIAGFFVAATQR
jgi:hypothetical protein